MSSKSDFSDSSLSISILISDVNAIIEGNIHTNRDSPPVYESYGSVGIKENKFTGMTEKFEPEEGSKCRYPYINDCRCVLCVSYNRSLNEAIARSHVGNKLNTEELLEEYKSYTIDDVD